MGYFSNGTEGILYEEAYCDRCVHRDGCAVWSAHMLHNYRDCNDKESILHILIPISEDRSHNEKCRMFYLDPNYGQGELEFESGIR